MMLFLMVVAVVAAVVAAVVVVVVVWWRLLPHKGPPPMPRWILSLSLSHFLFESRSEGKGSGASYFLTFLDSIFSLSFPVSLRWYSRSGDWKGGWNAEGR